MTIQRSRYIKRAYHECDELWRSKRRRALNDDQEAEPGVTTIQSSSSFPVVKKITIAAVCSVSSFFGLNKDELSRSAVRRFELFAENLGRQVHEGRGVWLYTWALQVFFIRN
ncbi:hypothetical protein BRADI_1g58731v3 [Brachypodium distachyon]|uniref:Uncharacterized protein n=1 Tax=Brachypodium distachyon TaxID=15368 RepID=A0A0Q3HEA6_BRADI|nr:hypothetical protein BRADI_1g58731v3 [Brachypodium distachyon]